MKKVLLVLFLFIVSFLKSSANDIQDVQSFFNRYVEAANSYSCDYFDYYSNDAKIFRVVEKPDGSEQSVNIPLERYKSEAKKSSKLARLRQYKNKYFNVKILPHGKDYKIVAMRMPSTSDYKIPAYFIIGKDYNGDWKIKEECRILRYVEFTL